MWRDPTLNDVIRSITLCAGAVLVEGRPTVVETLPGGKGTAYVVSIAREAGVEVVEMIK